MSERTREEITREIDAWHAGVTDTNGWQGSKRNVILADLREELRALDAAQPAPEQIVVHHHPDNNQDCPHVQAIVCAAVKRMQEQETPAPSAQADVRERVALTIRRASCHKETYPFDVWQRGEAEANILEWCRAAADSLAAAGLLRDDKPSAHAEIARKLIAELGLDVPERDDVLADPRYPWELAAAQRRRAEKAEAERNEQDSFAADYCRQMRVQANRAADLERDFAAYKATAEEEKASWMRMYREAEARADAAERERDRAVFGREHTEQWYAERLEPIQDVAKRVGVWPEVAAIIANGSGTRRGEDGRYIYDPPTYAQQLNRAKGRADALARQLAEAQKALEFYANPESWTPFEGRSLMRPAKAIFDKGDRARAALAGSSAARREG